MIKTRLKGGGVPMYTGSIQRKPNPRPQKQQQTKKETAKLQPHHPKKMGNSIMGNSLKLHEANPKTSKLGTVSLTLIFSEE